jgi:hypothetical protein
VQLNISYTGLKEIRSITWGLSGTGTPWRAFDFSNIPGPYQRLISYRTSLNSLPLQINDINCTPSTVIGAGPDTDYMYNKDGLAPGSRGLLTYRQNWSHQESLQHLRPTGEYTSIERKQIVGGFSLKTGPGGVTGSAQYQITGGLLQPGVLAEALTVWCFAVGTMTLHWTPIRVEMVST